MRWFEEPVSSDDLPGLRFVRERAPQGMAIAAGEYGYDLPYFERLLTAGAVDVLQADVTRCAGITDLRRIDALCRARSAPLSLHCSPTIHANVGPALETLVHLEYFHDHVRIEEMLFDGVPRPIEGSLRPNTDTPGLGVRLRATTRNATRCERSRYSGSVTSTGSGLGRCGRSISNQTTVPSSISAPQR